MLTIVESELQRLQDIGIISLITHTEWTAPIVAKWKLNGQVRMELNISSLFILC